MGMLDAVRQASHVLGAHPESFSNFSLSDNKLTFRHTPAGGEDRPRTKVIDNEFDLNDRIATYRHVIEQRVDKQTGEETYEGGFSPEAQNRMHGRDLLWRDNKWVPTPLKQDEP